MNTHRIHLRSAILAATTAAILSTAIIPQAAAHDHRHRAPAIAVTGTVNIKTGMTSVVLTDSFKSALASLGVDLRKSIPGQFVKGKATYRFPIRGGAFDLDTLQAEFTHAGGITLKTSTTTILLTDFIVNLPAPATEGGVTSTDASSELLPVAAGPQADLSALVVLNGDLVGRVSLFALDLSVSGLVAPATLGRNKKVTVPNVGLYLTAEGADALNAAFTVTSFVAGDAVGMATILATANRCDD